MIKAQQPESTLKKKHNAINFHRIREAIAMGIGHVGKPCGFTDQVHEHFQEEEAPEMDTMVDGKG